MYFRYTRVWGTCVVILVRTANGFSPIKGRFCLRLNPAGVKRPQNSTGEQRRGSSAIKCVGVDGRRTDARRKSKEPPGSQSATLTHSSPVCGRA